VAGVRVHFYFPAGVAYLSMTGIEVFEKKTAIFYHQYFRFLPPG
jgi:hypothetical protein